MSTQSDPDRDSIPGAFARLIERPVTALMVLVLLVVLGIVAYQRIPLMLMPSGATRPDLSVIADEPQSSPLEVAEKVTQPIEDELRMLPNVAEIRSTSDSDGAWVRLQFNPETNMDVAYAEVKDRLERVRPTLPDSVTDLAVRRRGSESELPIFYFGLLYDEAVEDPFAKVENLIQPRLESVDGVAQVQVWGMVEESVRVFVSPEKLHARGLSFYEVVTRLRRDNFTLPAGALREGGREFMLRIDSRYDDLDEIRAYPLSQSVTLGDVAEVVIGHSYRDNVSRVNGKPSLFGWIAKESEANTVATCALVREQFAALEQDARFAGFRFHTYFDQSEMIEAAVANLKESAAWGALFAVVVLYLFVRRLRLTLLVALAIPVSLTASLVACYFFDISFNVISLAGFTIAVGMLVDNSVVVAENIDRRRALGEPGFQAAVGGAAQVGLAIVLSTLTTIAVFLPMVFMAGDQNARIFLRELAFPITFSMVASLLVALVFLPIATIHFAGRKDDRDRERAERTYGSSSRLLGSYRSSLAWILRHRFGATLGVIAFLALASLATQHVETNFHSGRRGDELEVEVTLPRRFTLVEASEIFAQLETFFLERKDSYRFENLGVDFDRTGGSVSLWFDETVTDQHQQDLALSLRGQLPRIAGVTYRVGFQGGEEDGVRLQLKGADSRALAAVADDVVRHLARVEGLFNVRTETEEGGDELRIGIDRDRVQRFGIRPEALQGLIAWGVGGQRLPDFTRGDRDVPMIIEYEEPQEGDLEYLRALEVDVGGGESIPLAAFTQVDVERSLGTIRRVDGETYLGIVAESTDTNSYRVSRKLAEAMDSFPLPGGVSWEEGGRRRSFEEGNEQILKALIVGIVFVFLLMGMLFESSVLPLSVMLAIPPALIGAFVALWLSGVAQDETSRLSLIILAGIVVNNGIVLVDRIRQLRVEGIGRHGAVLDGCAQRLRPVLMTAITTMCGLVPMTMPGVFGSATGSAIDYQALAVATLGGLVLSTLLTLFVVPLFYTLFDDLSRQLARLVTGRVPQPNAGAAADPGAS